MSQKLAGLLWAKLNAIFIWFGVAHPFQIAFSHVTSGSALASYVGSAFGSSDSMNSMVRDRPLGAPKIEKAAVARKLASCASGTP